MFNDRDHKWVYSFNEGHATMKDLLGGKGAGVAEMTQAGLPVPPGFTITTESCRAYSENQRQFPEGMWTQARNALSAVESSTGKKFGGVDNPLLVSVRSGAAISMPGMMDTVLNLGLNDETAEGLAKLTGDRRFALDSYRRFIAMFGQIVMNVDSEKFDRVLERHKGQSEGGRDTDLTADQLGEVIESYKRIIFADRHGRDFPQDPYAQLRMAIAAVFGSWMGRRAVDYRRVHRISDLAGTAVNVQAMVFGNMGWDSGTGVAFTRNPSTGERRLYGEYLLNAQGEDVVAGIRTPNAIHEMGEQLPSVYDQLLAITQQLERHYANMQDIEFTVEQGKLYILQTRTGKRTGPAAVRIAVEMVEEGIIDRKTAVQRVDPVQLDQLLHPMVDASADSIILTTGLPASPGAASGCIVFDPDDAERQAEKGKKTILARLETSPDDFHGMVGAEAILTARGGMTSHAAVVARGMGKPCVVGAGEIDIDYVQGKLRVGEHEVLRGDWITVDGSTGHILLGQVPTVQPELGQHYQTLMRWADEFRTIAVRANADTANDARVSRDFGAAGIGLCRTEHMFFGEERLAIMREMILAADLAARQHALDKLLPIQRQDFHGIFTAMDGLPVTIRLLDPPLHEFLPNFDELQAELFELKLQLQRADGFGRIDELLREVWQKEQLLDQVQRLRESNPMLGHRGCRLGLVYPEVTAMQARAIAEAACEAQGEGISVKPEIMVPLVATAAELENQAGLVREVVDEVLGAYGMTMHYLVGTMIETPRAALTAGEIAVHADFFSFGTNDLTQTTFALSRDDSSRFLPKYITHKILPDDPFQVLDRDGVGQLVKMGVTSARQVKPDLKVGICGEHGGEPKSIAFCHQIGLDYVSCSPFRVPIARLAAAQASIVATARAEELLVTPPPTSGESAVAVEPATPAVEVAAETDTAAPGGSAKNQR